MRKNFVLTSLKIMLVLFVVGLFMMFKSTSIGQRAGSIAINANGGSMDGQQYNNVIVSTTENYRTGGMVISLVGGFGVLLSGYGLYKELEG